MKKSVKLLSLLLSAAFVFSSLFACGSSQQGSGESSDASTEKSSSDSAETEAAETESNASTEKAENIGTVKLLIDKDIPFDGAQAVIDAIEQELGIKTEIEIRPGGSEGDNIVKTRLATGDMADLFLYNTGSLLQAINPAENCLDMTDKAYASNITDDFKSSASVEDHVYAVPFTSTQAGAWVYNKKVYEELGLEVPHTWADLMANCEKIQEAGITPIIGSYKDDWTAQLIFLGDEYNVKASMPNFPEEFTANKAKYATTPSALRSWEKLAEANKYLNEDYLATTYDVALDMLVAGEGAHYPMLTQVLSNIYSLYPEEIDNIGVFGQPGDDANNHGLTVWMPSGIYVYKNTQNLELVEKWLDFYVSQKGFDIYSSVVKPDGPYAVKGIDLPDDAYAGVKQMQTDYFDTGKTDVALEFESPVKGSNCMQICVEVGSGITDAASGAAAYDKDVEKQAIQLNLPGW